MSSHHEVSLRAQERAQDNTDAAYRQYGALAMEIWKAKLADDERRLDDFVIETVIEPIKALVRLMLLGACENHVQMKLQDIATLVRDEAVRFADDDPDHEDRIMDMWDER